MTTRVFDYSISERGSAFDHAALVHLCNRLRLDHPPDAAAGQLAAAILGAVGIRLSANATERSRIRSALEAGDAELRRRHGGDPQPGHADPGRLEYRDEVAEAFHNCGHEVAP